MKTITQRPDSVLLTITLALVSGGIIMVFSASSAMSSIQYGDPHLFLKKDLIRVGIGLLFMYFAYKFDYHYFKIVMPYILVFGVILLGITLIPSLAGKGDVKGANRWLSILNVSLQPSELVKLAVIVFLSCRISSIKGKIKNFTTGLLPLLVPVLFILTLIVLQPNYSAVIGISAIVFFILVIGGADYKHIVALGLIEILVVAILLLGSEHSYQRISTYLGNGDPLNEAYQTNQSLIALGSGSLLGVGLGDSKQKMFYLPEPHHDFILAIVGEELGFVGTMAVMIGFLIFSWRGIKIALRARDKLGFLLAAGITASIFIHFAINVGVVTALLPVTGLPLPFLSYGGSFLLFTLVGVGILLNISTQLRCDMDEEMEVILDEDLNTNARRLALSRQKINLQVSKPLQRKLLDNETYNSRRRNRRTLSPST